MCKLCDRRVAELEQELADKDAAALDEVQARRADEAWEAWISELELEVELMDEE